MGTRKVTNLAKMTNLAKVRDLIKIQGPSSEQAKGTCTMKVANLTKMTNLAKVTDLTRFHQRLSCHFCQICRFRQIHHFQLCKVLSS